MKLGNLLNRQKNVLHFNDQLEAMYHLKLCHFYEKR